jgi:hypothetical protein
MSGTGRGQRFGMRRLAVLALGGLAVMTVVACNGGGSKSSTPSSASTPAAEQTAHPQPTIDGNTFTFPARGYAAVIPDGWHANPNSLLAGAQTVDTFFAADTVDGVQSNISVTCEENPDNVQTAQFLQNRLATLGRLAAKNLQDLGTTTVAGVPAEKFTYTLERGTTTIQKVDVNFATSKCGWTLAVASAPSTDAQNRTAFDSFLQSFKLLDSTPLS